MAYQQEKCNKNRSKKYHRPGKGIENQFFIRECKDLVSKKFCNKKLIISILLFLKPIFQLRIGPQWCKFRPKIEKCQFELPRLFRHFVFAETTQPDPSYHTSLRSDLHDPDWNKQPSPTPGQD